MDNSRFKFRVWDKVNKKLIYHKLKDEEDDFNYIAVSGDGVFLWGCCDMHIDEDKSDNHELMQSTGLYDCEGQEIWENDLVQVQPFAEDNDEGWLYEVKFINGSFCGIGLGDGEDDEELLSDLSGLNRCKIIGNRFENSELLEINSN